MVVLFLLHFVFAFCALCLAGDILEWAEKDDCPKIRYLRDAIDADKAVFEQEVTLDPDLLEAGWLYFFFRPFVFFFFLESSFPPLECVVCCAGL